MENWFPLLSHFNIKCLLSKIRINVKIYKETGKHGLFKGTSTFIKNNLEKTQSANSIERLNVLTLLKTE